MVRATRLLALSALLLLAKPLLPDWTSPRIDGSSPEAARASIERIERALPDAERRDFRHAFRLIVTDALSSSLGFRSGSISDEANRRVIAQLDGKTAREVIALAADLRTRRAPEPERYALAGVEL